MTQKRIAIITGSRAEYGLLYPLIKKLNNKFHTSIIVTGAHLESRFGFTYKEIENDGFKIDDKININLKSDGPVDICHSIALSIDKISKALLKLSPDIVILLGDRYEILGAAIASHVCGIPIAHIHGGELTIGAIDNAFRHAITKMSQLHFATTDEYKRRIIQMGEHPSTVFNVGALMADNIKSVKFLSKSQLEKELNIKFGTKNILITFHPLTINPTATQKCFKHLLMALDTIKNNYPDINIRYIFTYPNADTNGMIIIKLINQYINENKEIASAFKSLGRIKYLSLLKIADAVVGNSSSGMIEAPLLKTPTVNIGDRQEGRILLPSIINCKPETQEIALSIHKAISLKSSPVWQTFKNPYGTGHTSQKIIKILLNKIPKLTLKKKFYDIKIGT